ncbi:MAG: FecR domain-containing protein [Deltaproteobacteria bacterium]|nr:FecR domain-containing protein [Deltaproteobacteria bacterium]
MSERDRDLLGRHTGACPDCEAFAAFVKKLPDLGHEPSSAESRMAAIRARRTYFMRRGQKRFAGVAAAALAAAAVATLVFVVRPGGKGEIGPERGIDLGLIGGRVNVSGVVRSSGKLEAIGRTVTAVGGLARLRADAIATMSLGPGAVVEPVRLARDEVDVRLRSGSLAVDVSPVPARKVRFAVRTSLATVEVKGTVFSVDVGADEIHVSVVRGEVEVVPVGGGQGRAVRLVAGQSLAIPVWTIDALGSPARDRVLEMISGGAADEPQTGGARLAPQPAIQDDAPLVREHADRAGDKTTAHAGSSKDDAQPSMPSLAGLLDEARACQTARDWQCAADKYTQVRDLYPGLPEGRTVLVPLAEIHLRHLDRPEAALFGFVSYLKDNPAGPLVEEALFGVCRALRSLARTDEEKRALEEFLLKHPSSVLASKARTRLGELTANPE